MQDGAPRGLERDAPAHATWTCRMAPPEDWNGMHMHIPHGHAGWRPPRIGTGCTCTCHMDMQDGAPRGLERDAHAHTTWTCRMAPPEDWNGMHMHMPHGHAG